MQLAITAYTLVMAAFLLVGAFITAAPMEAAARVRYRRRMALLCGSIRTAANWRTRTSAAL